jgi:hypothetical protein
MDESTKIKEPDVLSGVAEAHAIYGWYTGGGLQSVEFGIIRGEGHGIGRGPLNPIVSERSLGPPEGLDLLRTLML